MRDIDSVAGDESRLPQVLTNGTDSELGGTFYPSTQEGGGKVRVLPRWLWSLAARHTGRR